jgi:universal stress protein A
VIDMQAILHPTDFSEASRPAYRLACTLAKAHGARLVLVHILPKAPAGSLDTEARKEQAWKCFVQLPPPSPCVPVEHRVLEGDPTEEILRIAREEPYEEIILGTHGRTGLSRILLGSVAEQILRRANQSVIVVKGCPAVIPATGEPVHCTPEFTTS